MTGRAPQEHSMVFRSRGRDYVDIGPGHRELSSTGRGAGEVLLAGSLAKAKSWGDY